VAAMFIDIAFGAPIYERLRAHGFSNVHEVNFGLTHTADRSKANMRGYMWDRLKDWRLKGAIPDDEKPAMDLAGSRIQAQAENRMRRKMAHLRKCRLLILDEIGYLSLRLPI
jgi:hypothetical protein